ncbi:tetrathionate reductase family octaheme c-type cytochrome [Vibrio sp. ZSDZ34]|uniref:Tetrathionate reductase family octaheme c-type cytochrome n=1 Tax=Vibrio gelatinilyticus TaxID=2893468 RepID=A0A9X2AZA9_9VIBR|nr:tetrathionate reductase family octaheme c-type cytochrome [Vibrio gelatinilyticus]MCJ2377383.1 tetrathionate reductase family octaheme c-type cytochrome [Vibrio gelatinilyticus]
MKTRLVIWLLCVSAFSVLAQPASAPLSDAQAPTITSTADHSQFDSLHQEFDYAPDVTEACLECHTEAGKQLHETFHWSWRKEVDGKMVGKGENAFNNYCISAKGNESCTQCHIGFGWRNEEFDFAAEENIDCLVCHDQTGTYEKSAASSGHPYYEDTVVGGRLQKAVDLSFVAQNVGDPGRDNCLSCHALGGGGNGVKHGDTDLSLANPEYALDVHMSPEKLNFSCQNCHTTSEHSISGRYNDRKAFVDHELNMGRPERIGTNVSCESCHSAQPHEQRVIDNHSSKVACTACHIPEMARGPYLTKLSWDWSTAGELKDGKPFVVDAEFDGIEHHQYVSKKGTFVWGRNVVPQYRWYKGELGQMTYLSDIDPTAAPIDINPPTGSYADPDARIWPFKIHQGKQPFDTELNRMLPIKLYGRKGSGAFWTEFDWDKALAAGAKLNNIEFSGQYDFIETNGYWPIKHMVAPASDSVACIECHSQQSRLNGLNDFYLVGRDRTSWVEYFGVIAIWGGLLGIILHALTRLFMLRKRRANHNIKDDES